MKVRRRSACAVIALALLAGCTDGADGGKAVTAQPTPEQPAVQPGSGQTADARTPYKLPDAAELSIVKQVNPGAKLPPGDTIDNNPYTRYLAEKTNVKFKVLWAAAGQDYQQKLKLGIASGDIPDVMIVDETTFRALADAEQIEDLTNVYAKHASPLLKELYATTKGKALEKATIRGKLMAMPNISIQADAPSLLWIRQDWLDKLGLKPPKRAADVAAIAKAFVERDPDGNGKADTIGLSGNASNIASFSGLADFTGLFAAHNAYPGMWLRDGSGAIVYGSVTPEAKAALGTVRDWYAAGLIDKQFALQKEPTRMIASGQSGMFFGAWWAPWAGLNDSVKNDPKADWKPYLIEDAEGRLNSRTVPVSSQFVVVKKGVKRPEALIAYINAFTDIQRYADPDAASLDLEIDMSYYPLYATFDYADAVSRKHDMLKKALDGAIKPEELTPEMKKHYDSWRRVQERPDQFDIGDWMAPFAYLYGGGALKQDIRYVDSPFTATTKTMDKKWANLLKLEQETYYKIAVGEKPLDDFDKFAKEWRTQGGDQIAGEIEAELRKQK